MVSHINGMVVAKAKQLAVYGIKVVIACGMKGNGMMIDMWRLWAKAIGEKASPSKMEADLVALIRTVIVLTYLLTNCFIIAGVIRHWSK